MATLNVLTFRTGVNNALNESSQALDIEAETGKVPRVIIQNRDNREPVMVVMLPEGVASTLSSAFGVVSSMEDGQMKDDVLGRNDL